MNLARKLYFCIYFYNGFCGPTKEANHRRPRCIYLQGPISRIQAKMSPSSPGQRYAECETWRFSSWNAAKYIGWAFQCVDLGISSCTSNHAQADTKISRHLEIGWRTAFAARVDTCYIICLREGILWRTFRILQSGDLNHAGEPQ